MNESDSQKKQQDIDRKIGYAIIAIIVIVGCTVIGISIYHMENPEKLRFVSFERVGNLKIEDPVNVVGIRIGSVKGVELRKESVLVSFTANMPLKLHQGYSVNDGEVGFMGDRMISITIGDTTMPAISDSDTLRGIFHPGVSEAIGMAGRLKGVVDSFVEKSARLLNGGPQTVSIVNRVNNIAAMTDSASRALIVVVSGLESGLSKGLDSLNLIIGGILRMSQAADSLTRQKMPGVVKQVGLIGDRLQKLTDLVDKLALTVDTFDHMTEPGGQGELAQLFTKIKMLRDAILHLKEGLSQLKKLTVAPL
jgi:hypothetical protein